MDEFRSLADLLDLQDVDSQIDRLLNERQSLPELTEYRAAHEKAADLATRHAASAASLKETELALDRTSGELELGGLKLSQEQNRLYAGGLSARDAEYLRREVDMLTRRQSDMEDEVLELMEQRDRLETETVELEDLVAEATAEKTRIEALIAAAWGKIDAQLAVKEGRKADIVPLIEEDLLDLYEDLRAHKEGVAVGRLADGVCGGCHLALTAAEQLEALRSEPPRCIHCRRILVP
jgi:predicted  nucleic acid-binding Zn-ribbon protein